jgi:hypothetical protein
VVIWTGMEFFFGSGYRPARGLADLDALVSRSNQSLAGLYHRVLGPTRPGRYPRTNGP